MRIAQVGFSNYGIATGARSRIFVLDVDGPEGLANLQELVGRRGFALRAYGRCECLNVADRRRAEFWEISGWSPCRSQNRSTRSVRAAWDESRTDRAVAAILDALSSSVYGPRKVPKSGPSSCFFSETSKFR
ncbi:bifunctional DNA primase/polymerase [Roseiarcus sp.]|uniref:bifunctional DNA primase/polymerase n=1 Tax=Roseiarcus sp. TaxID=1969460 RepID=UPI003F9AF67B